MRFVLALLLAVHVVLTYASLQTITYLQQREDDLMFRVDNLQEQLEAAHNRSAEVMKRVPPCLPSVHRTTCIVGCLFLLLNRVKVMLLSPFVLSISESVN